MENKNNKHNGKSPASCIEDVDNLTELDIPRNLSEEEIEEILRAEFAEKKADLETCSIENVETMNEDVFKGIERFLSFCVKDTGSLDECENDITVTKRSANLIDSMYQEATVLMNTIGEQEQIENAEVCENQLGVGVGGNKDEPEEILGFSGINEMNILPLLEKTLETDEFEIVQMGYGPVYIGKLIDCMKNILTLNEEIPDDLEDTSSSFSPDLPFTDLLNAPSSSPFDSQFQKDDLKDKNDSGTISPIEDI